VREPRPEVLTLDSLYDRMEMGFDNMRGYVNEQCDGIQGLMRESQQRQDENMRHLMMGLHIELPDYLRQPPVSGPSRPSGSSFPGGSGGYGYGHGDGYGYGAPYFGPGSREFEEAEPFQTLEPSEEEDDDLVWGRPSEHWELYLLCFLFFFFYGVFIYIWSV